MGKAEGALGTDQRRLKELHGKIGQLTMEADFS